MKKRIQGRFLSSAIIFSILGTSVVGSPAIAASAVQTTAATRLSPERLERLTGILQSYVDRGDLAGVVLIIRQDGRDVYSKALGWRDREARDPMREDTLFRIASQTKALTSVAVMMLMEEGKLLLSDPLGKHLPEWANTQVAVEREGGGYDVVPAKRPITIRDLLTHTSGISYGAGPAEKAWRDAGINSWYFSDRAEPVSAIVARMAALPMAAHPGEKFVYGYSTDILGVLVEKVSGKTLAAFLDERLIQPLGMKDTAFYVPREKAARLAVVYAEKDGGGITRVPDPGQWQDEGHVGQGHYLEGPRIAHSGGAGLVSTARDYSRFLEMLRQGGTFEGRRYLSPKTVALMSADHLGDIPYTPGMGFGLGFNVRKDLGTAGMLGSEGDYGWGGAYHSQYWIDPEQRMTVSYMVQLLPAKRIDDHGKLRSLIYQAIE